MHWPPCFVFCTREALLIVPNSSVPFGLAALMIHWVTRVCNTAKAHPPRPSILILLSAKRLVFNVHNIFHMYKDGVSSTKVAINTSHDTEPKSINTTPLYKEKNPWSSSPLHVSQMCSTSDTQGQIIGTGPRDEDFTSERKFSTCVLYTFANTDFAREVFIPHRPDNLPLGIRGRVMVGLNALLF